MHTVKEMRKRYLTPLVFTFAIVFANDDSTDCIRSSGDLRESLVLNLLNNAENLIKSAKNFSLLESTCLKNTGFCEKPADCAEVLENDRKSKNGIFKIWPRSRVIDTSIDVYCDMEDDGGAWTVIQRRGNFDSAKDYFFQDWAAYKKGFRDLQKDFWLGNDNIYALTNQRTYTVKFDLVDWDNTKVHAAYDEFYIDDEQHYYMSHVKGYRGNAGDSFSFTNGVSFSTKDRDNDNAEERNCADLYKGAWWYASCHWSNLNGLYLKGDHKSHADGVDWKTFRGYNHSMKDTVIKIRPKCFVKTEKIETNLTPQ